MSLRNFIENQSSTETGLTRPFVIAEAGVNHEGDMDIAHRLIDEAKEGGADAIKFQTYKAETIASENSPSYWDLSKEATDSQFKLFKKYDKFWKTEYEKLASYCQKVGIEFLSTPFDVESAQFLSELMDVFKISSSDINNRPFIDYLCGFSKPIVLSTGASYLWEVEQSVSWIKEHGNSVSLLHCILNYPTDDSNANLGMILGLSRKFPDLVIGYSDHTLPKNMKNLEIATLLGARIIEKHFTHDKSLPGNDHYHSMDSNDLIRLNKRLDHLFMVIGDSYRHPLPSEKISRANARRSLVAARQISPGKVITSADITWKRPGSGIDPRDIQNLVGLKAHSLIKQDAILKWEYFRE